MSKQYNQITHRLKTIARLVNEIAEIMDAAPEVAPAPDVNPITAPAPEPAAPAPEPAAPAPEPAAPAPEPAAPAPEPAAPANGPLTVEETETKLGFGDAGFAERIQYLLDNISDNPGIGIGHPELDLILLLAPNEQGKIVSRISRAAWEQWLQSVPLDKLAKAGMSHTWLSAALADSPTDRFTESNFDDDRKNQAKEQLKAKLNAPVLWKFLTSVYDTPTACGIASKILKAREEKKAA